MTLENKSFDAKLVELNAQLKSIQDQITKVEKSKQEAIKEMASNQRGFFLTRNSIPLDEVSLEKYNGIYFIVAKDAEFEYVMRLTKEQAEVLADDLDHEFGKELVDNILQKEIINNMFNPLFKNIKTNERLN